MIRFSLDINEQLKFAKELNFPEGYVFIPQEFFYLEELGLDKECLKPNIRAVWEAIQFFCNEYGSCIHPIEAIAKKAGISGPTYRRCIDLLKKNCLITVEERYDPITNARLTNRIFCNHPLLAAQLKNSSTPIQINNGVLKNGLQNSDTNGYLKQEEPCVFEPLKPITPNIKNDTPSSQSEPETNVMNVCKLTTYNNVYTLSRLKKDKTILSESVHKIFQHFDELGISIDIHPKSIQIIEKHMLNLSESDREKVVKSLKDYQEAGKIKNAAAWFISNPELVIKKALKGELNSLKSKENTSFNQEVIFFVDEIEKDAKEVDAVLGDPINQVTINEVKQILDNLDISEEVFLKNTPTITSLESLVKFSFDTIEFMANVAKEREKEKQKQKLQRAI